MFLSSCQNYDFSYLLFCIFKSFCNEHLSNIVVKTMGGNPSCLLESKVLVFGAGLEKEKAHYSVKRKQSPQGQIFCNYLGFDLSYLVLHILFNNFLYQYISQGLEINCKLLIPFPIFLSFTCLLLLLTFYYDQKCGLQFKVCC